jgi:hypothetical protein
VALPPRGTAVINEAIEIIVKLILRGTVSLSTGFTWHSHYKSRLE